MESYNAITNGENLSREERRLSEKTRGKGVGFERIRRITGYLVGTLDRFGNGKRAEEHDRVKHGYSTSDFIAANIKTKQKISA